jgi:hypothetical protein
MEQNQLVYFDYTQGFCHDATHLCTGLRSFGMEILTGLYTYTLCTALHH